jgi:hypothetical protein
LGRFWKVLEGFVFLVLIRLILLIFMEKFDIFLKIIYLKKAMSLPRFFFQFFDICLLFIIYYFTFVCDQKVH